MRARLVAGIVRGWRIGVRLRASGPCLKLVMYEAHHLVDLVGREFFAEGGHTIATLSYLPDKLLVRVPERVARFKAGDFQRQALNLDSAAVSVSAVALFAILSIVCARAYELVRGCGACCSGGRGRGR